MQISTSKKRITPEGRFLPCYLCGHAIRTDIGKGTNKPYYLREKGPKPSGVYIRVGRSKRKANDDEILRMIMDSHGYSYEDDISDEQTLTFKAFNQALEDNDIKLTPRLMNTLGLKNKTGKYTNLAYLLSDQSEIVVKVAEYDSEMNFKIKKSFIKLPSVIIINIFNVSWVFLLINRRKTI